MITAAISHAEAAAPLAALLPTRKGVAWQVGPSPQLIRAGAAHSRLTLGDRHLDVVEQDGRIEVFADRGDRWHPLPDAVVAQVSPDPVAEMAALVLRVVLPRLDREAAQATTCKHGWEHVIIDAAQDLNEVGYSLVDHGAHPEPAGRSRGVGLTWTASGGGEWGAWAPTPTGNLNLTYEGPAKGLYGALQLLLPSDAGHAPTDAGSAFTRHLTDLFPQMRPVDGHEVEFGRHDDVIGWVALPAKDEPADHMDSSRRIVAELGRLGPDVLLSAVPLLV